MKCTKQVLFVGTVICFHVNYIEPCIPIANGRFLKSTVTCVVDTEQEKRDHFVKQLPTLFCQLRASLGGLEGAFVMPPQLEFREQKVRHLQRWKFVLIQDLVVAKQLFISHAGPIHVCSRPVHKCALEGLSLGQVDTTMLNSVLQSHPRHPQQGAQIKSRRVIGQDIEANHGDLRPSFLGREHSTERWVAPNYFGHFRAFANYPPFGMLTHTCRFAPLYISILSIMRIYQKLI